MGKQGLYDELTVRKCTHLGGHEYAGNVTVYSGLGACADDGHSYGYVNPENVAEVLSGRVARGRLWRGRLGLTKDEARQERRLQVAKNLAPIVGVVAAVAAAAAVLQILRWRRGGGSGR